jgi:hypothetical protein
MWHFPLNDILIHNLPTIYLSTSLPMHLLTTLLPFTYLQCITYLPTKYYIINNEHNLAGVYTQMPIRHIKIFQHYGWFKSSKCDMLCKPCCIWNGLYILEQIHEWVVHFCDFFWFYSTHLVSMFLHKMSQPHFGLSVRMKLTLTKVRTWSPLGLLKIQSSSSGVKTPCIGVFLIPLERSWSVDVQNGLARAIWTSAAQVMGKRRAGSQTGSLILDH